MFGLSHHQRSRSLIPVKDLEKSEKKVEVLGEAAGAVEQEEEEAERWTPRQNRNLVMIYLLFLAEAVVASSLSLQVAVLVPSEGACLSMNSSFLRSILECAYFFGGAMGIFWGRAADRFGRRRVALVGLVGMFACCATTGFLAGFVSFAVLRFVAGAIISATRMAGLAMLADVTYGSTRRTKVIARLPLVAVCGSIAPLASKVVRQLGDGRIGDVFAKFPSLGSQIACASLVGAIAIAELILLEETLPGKTRKHTEREAHADPEKAAFLGQSLPDDSDDSLSISLIDALNDDAAAPRPSYISLSQMLSAPFLLIMLASFALLSLHSSTFEVLLPHIGHTATHDAGMGIPCAWLGIVTVVVKVVAAVRILRGVPFIVGKVGLLPIYRKISLAFPVLYVLIPLAALVVNATGAAPLLSAIISTTAMLVKSTLAGAAQVLVLLLVLSAAPDASSTGTVIGVVSTSELFKALAVGVSGVAYYLSDDYSTVIVNGLLWTALAVTALIGAVITRKLRETPRVGTDIPAECLVWQGVFDSESEDEIGF